MGKTADEMLEEIGYEKIKDDKYYVIYEMGASIRKRMIFKELTKTVCCILIDEDYDWNDALDINMEELQAIYKKCQEKGWIEWKIV